MAAVRISGGADDREAAAAIAAIERFVADTAPAPAPKGDPISPWQRAALLEGVSAKQFAVAPALRER